MRDVWWQRLLGCGVLAGALAIGTVGQGKQTSEVLPSMPDAANGLLESLSSEQKKQATLPFDDKARLDWHFIPKADRKGVQLKEMSEAQREKAHALLRSGVSGLGYKKATAIMSLEAILAELEKSKKGGAIRDPLRYYFTIFGTPAATGRWGWSVEGHHLSLNFVVENGTITSVTPAFYGANPAKVVTELPFGMPHGTRVLAAEEDVAFQLLHSLSADQKKTAVIDATAPGEIRAAGEPQPPQTPPAGLPFAKMEQTSKDLLRQLVTAYTEKMPPATAEQRKAEIDAAGWDQIHFAWAGADQRGVGHYYRVQGPTFLIEFVNNQPDSLGNKANHIHSIWRQMKGDFGIPVAGK